MAFGSKRRRRGVDNLWVAWRLYLPEGWANDRVRRAKAGVPEDVVFRTKPEIALDQIRTALSAGVPNGVLLADAGYGVDTAFRTGLTAMGLGYILGIQSSTSLWPPGMEPLPPKAWSGRGRPPSLIRRDPEHKPVAARQLAQTLPESAWRTVTWREGVKGPLALCRRAHPACSSRLLALCTANHFVTPPNG